MKPKYLINIEFVIQAKNDLDAEDILRDALNEISSIPYILHTYFSSKTKILKEA